MIIPFMWLIFRLITFLFFYQDDIEATITPKVSACSTPGKWGVLKTKDKMQLTT